MIRGILFDLDGTLLDIDLESFLAEYFSALGPVLAEIGGDDASPESSLKAVIDATNAMCSSHPDRSNRDVFNEVFLQSTGVDLDSPDAIRAIDEFYSATFPTLQRAHGPRQGARDAYEAAVEAGLRPMLATNPIFPRDAIVERLRWAGFTPDEFEAITSYEQMRACKPLPGYFRQAASLLGLSPDECLMVGDDPVLDAAAADIGMRVFYVGPAPAPTVDWSGTFDELSNLLTRLE